MPGEDYVVDLGRTANEIISLGVHTFKVVSVEKKEGTKAPYLNWKLEVADPRDPHNGKQCWHITSLSEAARFKLEEFMDALGLPQSGKLSVSKMVGYKLRGEVVHEADTNGVMRPRLKSTMTTGQPQYTATASAGDFAVTEVATAPAGPPPRQQVRMKQEVEDDIPF